MKKSVGKKNLIDIMVLGLYIAFNIFLLVNHEMWRDELNVWLMGRDLSPVELLREIRLQGHPCLWYFLVMPFAKMGVPCKVMCVLSLLSVGIGAFLFYLKAPINKAVKAVALFTPAFTYYYSVIARGYCLVALLVILAACMHKERDKKPILYGLILGLLVQADTIGVPIAGMMSLMWLGQGIYAGLKKNGKKNGVIIAIKGLWIPLLSVIFYLLQMKGAGDSTAFEIKDLGLYDTVTECKGFAYHIGERLTGWPRWAILVFAVLLIVGLLWMSLKGKTLWPLIVFGGYLGFQVVFSVFVYELNIWHFLALIYVLIWTVWVYRLDSKVENAKIPGFAVQGLLFVLVVFTFVRWNYEEEPSSLKNAVAGVYSNSVEAAEFLENNISPNELIVADGAPYVGSIFGYAAEYRFCLASTGEETSYSDWSEKQCRETTFDEVNTWVKEKFPDAEEYIFIRSNESYVTDFKAYADGLELIYESKESSAMLEDYKMYRVCTNGG